MPKVLYQNFCAITGLSVSITRLPNRAELRFDFGDREGGILTDPMGEDVVEELTPLCSEELSKSIARFTLEKLLGHGENKL